jgi:predicted AAA+ superfamily ATPase
LATSGRPGVILVLDEVQKLVRWSETVKRLWDEDTRARRALKVILLGSAPLLIQRGLSESLAGRFEVIHLPHWSYLEMQEAFGWSLEQYLFYGGYPGAAPLIDEPERWARYVKDALIETTFAHCDRYNLVGDHDREEIPLNYTDALDLADRDINDNWDIYQERFLRGDFP